MYISDNNTKPEHNFFVKPRLIHSVGIFFEGLQNDTNNLNMYAITQQNYSRERKKRVQGNLFSVQKGAGPSRQHERGFMNFGIVVSVLLLLFVDIVDAQRLVDFTRGILAADHESDLARRIGGNSRVCVFGDRKNFRAGFLEIANQGHVQPDVFS